MVFGRHLKKKMSSSSPISPYVQSIIESDALNAISEEEVFEITTKATSSSSVYSGFAELANALERIRMKRKNDDPGNDDFGEKSARLLELFSFGTFDDCYHQQQHEQQQSLKVILNEKQEEKLKQLSVVSLSYETKVLSYEILMQQLHLNSVRELEDFLIEKVISPGIVKGQMNQELSVFEVFSAIGRDPNRKRGRVEKMLATVREWKGTCDDALKDIENQIVETKTDLAMEDLRKVDVTRKQEEAEKRASANVSGGGGGGSGGIEEEVDAAIKEESGSAGGTKRKK